ncbi:MAG: electron transfer flavoprotein subunit beta/FixA family protein [candidate division WOR-3 bacterium]|nr:MAG: electron transfer flavoprotein subunit beta/FixA family protein [candidate division WOR-3 bacterium]
MDIIVCVKRVPQTAEAEVKVDSSGKDIIRDRLTFDMNESDTYALEEAILLKEKFGGAITVISLGSVEAEDTLRIAMAKGADNAIRIKAEDFGELDGYKTAQLLGSVIKDIKHDIILTGCLATDDYYAQVGVALAELIGIPHATLVTKIDIVDSKAHAYRELEGGLLEHLEINLPALLTIQTGINEPRYASLIAIRRAAKKEIKTVGKADIAGGEIMQHSTLEELFTPPVGKRAEILTGSMDEIATKLTDIIKGKGLL